MIAKMTLKFETGILREWFSHVTIPQLVVPSSSACVPQLSPEHWLLYSLTVPVTPELAAVAVVVADWQEFYQ